MRRFRSKAAYTLVELVVTITILSITSGMGLGIFVTAMRNYSRASITERDQESAIQIESFILRNARQAQQIVFFTNDGSYMTKWDKSDSFYQKDVATYTTKYKDMYGGIVTNTPMTVNGSAQESPTLEYYDRYVADDKKIAQTPVLSCSGVESITFTLRKQKTKSTELEKGTFNYIFYEIKMQSGYTVSGSAILYNCTELKVPAGNSLVVSPVDGRFVVGNDKTHVTGIGFMKKKAA